MEVLEKQIASISLWISRAGGFLLLIAALLVSFEVLARKVFLLSFNVGTELAMYSLAVGSSFAFANALLEKAHVRIDVIHRLLPDKAKAALDILAMLAIAGLASVLAYYAGDTAITSLNMGARENTPLGTPLALPQGLWFVGIFWLAFVAFQRALQAFAASARGNIEKVFEIAGTTEADAEVTEAISFANERLMPGKPKE